MNLCEEFWVAIFERNSVLYCVLKKAHQKVGRKKLAKKAVKKAARKLGKNFIPELVLPAVLKPV